MLACKRAEAVARSISAIRTSGARRRGLARRQKLVVISQLEAAHHEMVNSDAVSPFDQLLARMESDKLREALRSIPEEFAEAVELHDVHGLKYLEIAQITSVPLGTVMSRISRGRRLLAGLLALRADEEEGTLRKARGR